MSDGVLAGYLLAVDSTRFENQAKIKDRIEFAESDDEDDPFRENYLVERIGVDDLNAQLRFDVPPAEAIDYFKRKKIDTKEEFLKLSRQAKAGAFTVGGIYEQDILEAFQKEIVGALETGQTQKFVTDKFKSILSGAAHKELGNYHLESVFRTNVQMAYGVGRRRAMEAAADDLPLWEYVAVNDDRTRPTHRALDGITFPANHPFWDEHFPPWGFSCRCSTIATFNYRKDYDHSKPNADTTIAFDEKGVPAKAEYLTQVIDLKATKFVGVPQQANLKRTLKSAAKRSKESRKKGDNKKNN